MCARTNTHIHINVINSVIESSSVHWSAVGIACVKNNRELEMRGEVAHVEKEGAVQV